MAHLERLNLVGEMAAGIGHEIRNPVLLFGRLNTRSRVRAMNAPVPPAKPSDTIHIKHRNSKK